MDYNESKILSKFMQIGKCPILLGILFFVVALSFTIYSIIYDKNVDLVKECYLPSTYKCYLDYAHNVSWSFSLLFIFPAFLGLSIHFYNTFPHTFESLYKTAASPPNKEVFQQLWREVNSSVNNIRWPFFSFVVALILNFLYFCDLSTSTETQMSWIIRENGLTGNGRVAVIVQLLLSTYVLNFVFKSLLMIKGFYYLFNEEKINAIRKKIQVNENEKAEKYNEVEIKVILNPFHPDGVSGLEKLSSFATIQAMMLFLLGVYVSLKAIDRIYIQSESIFSDIGNPVMITGYVVFAPLMFFLILGSAHRVMQEGKERVLSIFCDKIKIISDQIKEEENLDKNKKDLDFLKVLQEQRALLEKSILVWPFDMKSIQGFFSAVVTPLIAPLITGLAELFNFISNI